MNYLDTSEYQAYGLEATTPEAMVSAASAVINAHCRRPTLSVAQYTERFRLRQGQRELRLTHTPLAAVAPATSAIIAARVRYGSATGDGGDLAAAFGLPGAWSQIDTSQVQSRNETGEIELPGHILGISYTEAEITYTAGLAQIPEAVKFACAQIVRNAAATPALNVRASQVDRMQMEYFADTLLDACVRGHLAPYVAQRLG